MAELSFYFGSMNAGKSTFALQWCHNARSAGKSCMLLTKLDRGGGGAITSRIGLSQPATLVTDDLDLFELVTSRLALQMPVDVVICDEAQFFSADQIRQLTRIVDELGIDVLALGLLTDFQSRLFPGSARLMELADRREELQVESRCWCGDRGQFNARVVNGVIQREGAQVVVGDVGQPVGYEVLCRPHYFEGVTTAQADVCHLPVVTA